MADTMREERDRVAQTWSDKALRAVAADTDRGKPHVTIDRGRKLSLGHPLRVLLVVDSLEVGGAERHVVDLASALCAAGHAVDVVVATGGPLAEELAGAQVRVRAVGTWRVKHRIAPLFAARLRTIVRSGEFDVVHSHLYASNVAAWIATLGMPCPHVVTVHSEGAWETFRARRVIGTVYRSADSLIAVSEPIASALRARHEIARERIAVIPNALFRTCKRIEDVGPARFRAGTVIGVVCRLHRDKGVDLLLEAMSRVVPRHPQVQAIVVGDGPRRKQLERQVRALQLQDRVQFLGCRPMARGLMPSFDLLVVPSRTEGTPLVTLEAMEVGVPIVATRVGGITDQIRHGRDGLLVPVDDPEELAGAIERLLDDSNLRRSLAEAARRRFDTEFAYPQVLTSVLNVYADARLRRASSRSRLRHGRLPAPIVRAEPVRTYEDAT